MKKLSIGILTTALVLGLTTPFAAFAKSNDSSDKRPRLSSIEDVAKHSAVLTVFFRDFRDKDVVAKVRIKNDKTGAVTERKFNLSLSDRQGKGDIKIDKLSSNTTYLFKVKLRRESSEHFTRWSNQRRAMLLP